MQPHTSHKSSLKGLLMATGSTTTTDTMGIPQRTRWVKNILLENELEVKTLATVIAAVVLCLIVIKKFPGSKSRGKLPPGPLNLPVVGAIFSVEGNLGAWFKKLAKTFGKIVYFRLGPHRFVIVSSAEGAEVVLRTKDALFANRPGVSIWRTASKYVGFESEDILYSNYNEKHTNLKKLLSVHVFNLSAQHRFQDVRRREGAFLVEDIQKQMKSEGIINVGDFTFGMTVNFLCSLMFGMRHTDSLGSGKDQLKHCSDIVNGTNQLLLRPNPGDIFPWLAWAENYRGWTKEFKEFNELCRRVFGQSIEDHREERRTNKSHTDQDFLDILLTLHDEGKISENALLGSLVNMLAGGTETNARTSEWIMLELVKHPECLAKLRKELDDVVGQGRPVEESDFSKLPYLEAVINETFRLHTPIPLLAPHFTTQATTVQGFHIPANTAVFVNVALIARDPLLWEHPDKFYPERFMNSTENVNVRDGNVFSLLPFGSGRRKCPAAGMGVLTVQRIVATLVHVFDWSPPPGKTSDAIDTAEVVAAASRPASPLLLCATPRLDPAVYTGLLHSIQ